MNAVIIKDTKFLILYPIISPGFLVVFKRIIVITVSSFWIWILVIFIKVFQFDSFFRVCALLLFSRENLLHYLIRLTDSSYSRIFLGRSEGKIISNSINKFPNYFCGLLNRGIPFEGIILMLSWEYYWKARILGNTTSPGGHPTAIEFLSKWGI
jgi:hypothetical protein